LNLVIFSLFDVKSKGFFKSLSWDQGNVMFKFQSNVMFEFPE